MNTIFLFAVVGALLWCASEWRKLKITLRRNDMKAPKKIYIQTNAGEAFSSKWTTIPFRDFENTEYIRKDAVLDILENSKHLADAASKIDEL